MSNARLPDFGNVKCQAARFGKCQMSGNGNVRFWGGHQKTQKNTTVGFNSWRCLARNDRKSFATDDDSDSDASLYIVICHPHLVGGLSCGRRFARQGGGERAGLSPTSPRVTLLTLQLTAEGGSTRRGATAGNHHPNPSSDTRASGGCYP